MSKSTKRFVFFRIYFCSYMRVYFQLDAFVREHVWRQALLMGCLMRLELTRVFFKWFSVGYGFCMNVGPSFFLECVSLSLL